MLLRILFKFILKQNHSQPLFPLIWHGVERLVELKEKIKLKYINYRFLKGKIIKVDKNIFNSKTIASYIKGTGPEKYQKKQNQSN